MPLYVKDEKVNSLAAQAQRALGVASKTEAVRIALERLLRDEAEAVPLRERVKVFQERTRGLGESDPSFDEKRFLDEMWGHTEVFLETSAVVEYLLDGPRAAEVIARIEASPTPTYVSPIVEFEATVVIATRKRCSVPAAQEQVAGFLDAVSAVRMDITLEIGRRAVAAFAVYGKGRGHPAGLNFGDCFSYAAAKSAKVPLLYVGADFSHTDLA